MDAMPGFEIGPAGRPAFLYVLYGLMMPLSAFERTSFRSSSAYWIVASISRHG